VKATDAILQTLDAQLREFREQLREWDVVSELNPTSNHMLLADSFTDGHGAVPAAAPLGAARVEGGFNTSGRRNTRTLPIFWPAGQEEACPPVVLCTDDDGIWAIRKCREHYHHISVAHEYCQAIVRGEIAYQRQLMEMIDAAQRAVFWQP